MTRGADVGDRTRGGGDADVEDVDEVAAASAVVGSHHFSGSWMGSMDGSKARWLMKEVSEWVRGMTWAPCI